MGKRFSRLKYALKAIQDPTSTAAANTPPTGSILDKYNEFATGSTQVSYPREATSKTGGLDDVAINPFSYPVAAESLIKVPISKRVKDATAVSTVRNAANITTDVSAVVNSLENYIPAKATVFIANATQSDVKETSQITGIKYNPTEGVSYTMPYGSTTGEEYESLARAGINVAVATITNASVSFKSERL